MSFKLLILFCVSVLLSFSPINAQSEVSDFDLISYNPVKVGLKDFYCELRVEGLTEQIKKEYVTLKINDEIYYKVYWMYPGKVDLVVEGLPKGFDQLKAKLAALVINRLDFIVPQDLSTKMRGYKLTKKGSMYEGVDPTNKRPVNKIEISFNGEGVLKHYKSYSPLGFQNSDFSYGKKSWSKNKWVLEKIVAKAIQGPQVTETVTEISYDNFAGFGMPTSIDVDTTQRVSAPGKSEKKIEREGETELKFSNYQINVNVAAKHFRNGKTN